MPNYSLKRSTFYLLVVCSLTFTAVLLAGIYQGGMILKQPSYLLPPAKIIKTTTGPFHGIATYLIEEPTTKKITQQTKKFQAIGFPLNLIKKRHIKQHKTNNMIDLDFFKQHYNLSTPNQQSVNHYFTYMKTLRSFLHSSSQYALIMYPSSEFNPKKLHSTIVELTQQNKLWDIIDLSKTSFNLHSLHATRLKNGKTLLTWPNSDKVMNNFSAYLVNRHAAQQLFAKSYPMRMKLPDYLTRDWEFGIKSAVIEPGMVTIEPKFIINNHLTKKLKQKSRLLYTWTHLKLYLKHTLI